MLFVQIDTADETAERIMEFFNIKDEDTPTTRLINLEDDMRKYIPDFNDITDEKISPFIEAYLAGELKVSERGRSSSYPTSYPHPVSPPFVSQPHLNTEDIPDDWDSNPVKTLVGKNFDEVVNNPANSVFVEFCKSPLSPGC